ncbi:MAG: SufS family cysteine desulfurase [Lachnospiraceae bacterium]|nr:SufS family cysteine desulfurase [Lachnospiraceae bacterium]
MISDKEKKIREDFPLINEYVNNVAGESEREPLIYLDNSATSQKPKCVIEAIKSFYEKNNANPMRGLYDLSICATEEYEKARRAVAEFINASPRETVFTKNATESLNLVAYSYGLNFIKEGDEIIVSVAEHHSNMLPWQQAAKIVGAKIVWYDCDEKGFFDTEKLKSLITDKTKLLAITQVSNVLGRINDVKTMGKLIHEKGGVIVVDGSQSVPHMAVDVKELDADFLVFSGHKMYGPMGIGVLYGKAELLEKMPPFLTGGEMIESVTKEKAIYAEVPHKFEAGTVSAADAVGLKAAIDFINEYGIDYIKEREDELTRRAFEGMKKLPYIKIIGGDDAADHHGIIAFQVDGVHPHDVAQIFSDNNIAVRAGHHCAQPLHKYLGAMSTTRMSLSFYNTEEEIDAFLEVLSRIRIAMGLAG